MSESFILIDDRPTPEFIVGTKAGRDHRADWSIPRGWTNPMDKSGDLKLTAEDR